ncbi:MAG: helix-turn-helix transcriptional regulator [Actinobacteria bacterium]|jgi:transcriptional regulator with XRE-family HTH domain|nr:hypothetical protein [Candidatus Poribacteria bacterium]MBT3246132.1 helix-turn-helix transcriptional regulator [Actinomycetota bacterium]MDP7551050.1 helix-turn-helix transcriptional regulator [Acidimicrobiales bacterium]MBT3688352.1 helix-turn-helix transcriptional regulator [Actinomycetota bacterium]MBT4037250.1 helix-turn-helix transcriptional regulator [Actinomycetota bacterium]|tara:strand:- start:1102 stop:1425 length:324 start_codon:yes stop_codon:yes gene_type:complete
MEAATILRLARTRANLSLRSLGRAAGTSHATLSAYEAGTKTPSVATLDRIVRAAGFAMDATLSTRVDIGSGSSKGEELEAVLDLAGAFPARHSATLTYPPFPQPVET